MMHRPLNHRLKGDDVYGQPRALGERTKFVVHGLDLDGVEGNKCCLTRALVPHVVDAVDRSFLLVDYDRVHVTPKHHCHRRVVLALRRLAVINHSPTHPGEDTLQVRKCLFEARLTLGFVLVNTSLGKLLVNVDELLVCFFLQLPGN